MSDEAPEIEWLPIGEGPAPNGVPLARQAVRPEANPSYSFQLAVPQAWIPDVVDGMDREVHAQGRTPLAGWHAPVPDGEPAVVFAVEAMGVLRAVSASHMLQHQATLLGMEVVAVRELSPYFVDALCMHRIEGQPFAVRTALWLVGDRAFVASGIAHVDALDQHNPVFGTMIASLQIDERPAVPHTERRVTHTLFQRVAFDLPGSFVPLPLRSEETRHILEFMQKSPKNELTSLLGADLQLADGEPDLDAELIEVGAQLVGRGAVLGDEVHELEVASGESVFALRRSLWVPATSEHTDVPQEVWMSFIDAGGDALRVFAVGPARGAFFRDWAVLQRGYRILLETLRPA